MKLASRSATGIVLCAIAVVVGLAVAYWRSVWPWEHSRPDRPTGTEDERLALHFFVTAPASSHLPDSGRDFVKRTIEDKFHVSLTVTYMPQGEAYTAKIASLLASNDPPDMWLNVTPDEGAQYTLDNVLADMTYYVTPSAMPNYFAYWVSPAELKAYQIHNKFARAPIPYDKQSYRAYYIRNDWLQRLGLAIPATYEQYVNVLQAFTHNDPDGNGKNDTYGFTASGNGSSISLDWPEYIKNGLLYPQYYENDRLVDMQMDTRVGQVATDILSVMDQGLVDPDWFLNSDSQALDKAVQGKVGIVLGNTKPFAFDSDPGSLQARSKAVNPSADWVPFNPFADRPLRAAVTPGYPFVLSNNAAGLNPDKLKRTVAILDWLAGEEGFLLTHYGQEGKHYTRQGNTITLLPQAIERDIGNNGDFLKIWGFFTPDTPETLGLTVIDPRVTARDRMIARFVASIPVHEGVGVALTPPLGISVEAMRARQDELQVKMLFSDKSGDKWPVYREEIMKQYNGAQIFNQYEQEIRAAQQRR